MTHGGSTEVEVKLVVSGAAGCGRGELLRAFADRAGGVPVREGTLGGSRIWRVETIWPQPMDDGRLMRVRLFALTGVSEYNAVEELLLRDVAGVVSLIDVTPDLLEFGWDSLSRLSDNLKRVGLELGELPLAVQYHRTDRHYGFDPARMDQWLGLPVGRVARFVSQSGGVDFEGGAIDSVVAQIAAVRAMPEES